MKKMKAYSGIMNFMVSRDRIMCATFCAAISMIITPVVMPVSAQQRTGGVQREAQSGLPANCTSAAYMQDGDVVTQEGKTYTSTRSGISGNSITNIYGNGHTVYYDKDLEENKALGGKTFTLAKGGTLTPGK